MACVSLMVSAQSLEGNDGSSVVIGTPEIAFSFKHTRADCHQVVVGGVP